MSETRMSGGAANLVDARTVAAESPAATGLVAVQGGSPMPTEAMLATMRSSIQTATKARAA